MAQVINGIQAVINAGLAKAAIQLQPVITQTVDAYLLELRAHMGHIPGTNDYSDEDVKWEELKDTEGNFWYETGAAANSIVIKTVPYRKGFKILIGIPPGAPGYNEAMWNEFGWHPKNGEKLVRRALFIPLGEDHLRTLTQRLQKVVSKYTIRIKVNL